MGIIRSTFRFSNPVRTDLQAIDIDCLVDTGAVPSRHSVDVNPQSPNLPQSMAK